VSAQAKRLKLPDKVCQTGSDLPELKHHVQFDSLPSRTSVPCFSKVDLSYNNCENVLDFGSYRRFLTFAAFDLRLGTIGMILALTGTAIHFVVNFLIGFILF